MNYPEPGRMPKCIRGFHDIARSWDKVHGIYAAKILPGEYYVTISDEAITTVLGSCVSACIRDKVFGIGGMNHFMLPMSADSQASSWSGEATRFGNFAMEKMINDILKNGGRRENLEVKVVGGGKIISHMTSMDIGSRNIKFIRDYIQTENLSLIGEDLGDEFPRKVIYFPATGTLKVKKLRKMHSQTVLERENTYMDTIEQKPVEGDIELF